MKKKISTMRAGLAAFPLSILSVAISSSVLAQENEPEENPRPTIQNPLEEMLILGRQQSAAQDLVLERMEFDTVVDLLGADQIARVGDSNVADALRRVPGLTLVDGKFVYIRGLGERYQNVTLNGATVPSPDLTRNVIPLDIFPTSIVESLSVQKGYSADKGAHFAGGSIDIRTTSIPESFVAYLEGGIGINSLSDEYLDYSGGHDFGDEDGSRELPSEVRNTLATTFINNGDFDLSAQAIQQTANRNGNPISLAEAENINRQLALSFNRDLDIRREDSSIQDFNYGGGIGNAFELGSQWVAGVLATINYGESIRTQDRTQRQLEEPELEFTSQTKSTQNASLTVTFGGSLKWSDDHTLETKNFFIRNTDDEVFESDEFNDTSDFSSGNGFREFATIFEQRELEVYQVSGSHKLGFDTQELLGIGDSFLTDLEISWFFSDSEATTDIPNASTSVAQFNRNIETGEVSNVNLTLGGITSNGLLLETLDLQDELESSGFDIKLPLSVGDWSFELSGGTRSDRRARISDQLNLAIDGNASINNQVTDSVSERFSDANILNPAFDFQLGQETTDFGPSLAATQIDSSYGQLEIDWNNTWALVLGARYEDYRQVGFVFDPLARESPILPDLDVTDFNDSEPPPGVFQDDDVYLSASLKFTTQDFWAEDFNLHLSWSETTVRPDLREIVDTSYRDPVTDFIISGNPDVTPSDVTNIDIRGEWFFGNGNNFTVSLFQKDIDNPIEIFSQLSTGNEQRAEVLNAETAEVAGIELEWLVNLEFLGEFGSQFFVQGNTTSLFTNEIDVGDREADVTNRQRELTQASDFIANLVFGFDSDDGKHSAGLAFNTFSERIFFSGTAGREDTFEQPFDSLDLTYTFFFTDDFSLKFKAKNLLDGMNEITQENQDGTEVTVFEQEVGQSYSLGVSYKF